MGFKMIHLQLAIVHTQNGSPLHILSSCFTYMIQSAFTSHSFNCCILFIFAILSSLFIHVKGRLFVLTKIT